MRSDSAFSSGSTQALLSLVILSGITLAISIQPPSKIAVAAASDLSHLPLLFPMASEFLLGVFAMSCGALVASDANMERIRFSQLKTFVENIAAAIALLLPFFMLARAIIPTRGVGITLLLLYMALSSFFFALLSFGLEVRGRQGRRGGFILRYGLYLAFCAIPIGVGALAPAASVVASVSPVGLAMRIAEGTTSANLVVGMSAPLLGIIISLIRLRRIERRPHAV